MTELVNGTSQADVLNSNPVAPSHSSPSTEEKVLRQSEVNEIVGRAKHEAVERYKRSQEAASSAQIPMNANSSSYSHDEINRIAQDAAQKFIKEQMEFAKRNAEEQEAQHIINEFRAKLQTGKEKYQDFDQVTSDIGIGYFPRVIHLLAKHADDSAASIMYEMGKDRTKLVLLEQLAEKSPQDAVMQIKSYAKAYKDNESAAKAKVANEPLSHMKPSASGQDNGVKSVRDYRKMFRG